MLIRDNMTPHRSGASSEGHPETRVSDLRREFSQRLDSHASTVKELVDQRLDGKLSKFAELMGDVRLPSSRTGRF